MPGAPEITEFRVHIGAHKTATTHLQYTLDEAAPAIRALGGNFLSCSPVRKIMNSLVPGRRGRVAQAIPALSPLLLRSEKRKLLEYLRAQMSVSGSLILSDEQFLGKLKHCISAGTLYPDLSKMAILSLLSTVAPLTIFVSIRSLDGYIPSGYATALKHKQHSRRDLERFTSDLRSQSRHWTTLVSRVQKIAPNARIFVWNYDEYQANWQYFMRTLLGLHIEEFPRIDPPDRTRTPSDRAISIAETQKVPAGILRAEFMQRIYLEETRPEDRKFDPLSAEDKRYFRNAFEEDLRALKDHLIVGTAPA